MNTEHKKFVRWYILGAAGGGLMAAGDWLLGCVPIQATDTGMFDRAYYLSGSYGLWRPVLIVGLGAATWMSVMSQSSTNTAIVIWCAAAAVYGRRAEKEAPAPAC